MKTNNQNQRNATKGKRRIYRKAPILPSAIDKETEWVKDWISTDLYMFQEVTYYLQRQYGPDVIASHLRAQFNSLREQNEQFTEGIDADKVDWFALALAVPSIFRATAPKFLNRDVIDDSSL